MKVKRLSVALLCIMHYALCIGMSVKSPNGNVELTFSVDPDGRPVYEMSYKGRAVVKPSFLGLELAKDKHASMGLKEHDLMAGFKIEKEETSSFDETWKPVWGETATIRNHYNELAVTLSQQWLEGMPSTPEGRRPAPRQHNRQIIIRFRVYSSTTSLSRRSAVSLRWRVAIRLGGCLAITIPRNRRLRNANFLRSAAV